MRWLPLFGIFLFLPVVSAIVTTSNNDNFFVGSNCNYDAFSCGSSSDWIGSSGSVYNTTFFDDGLATYVCSTSVTNNTAVTRSCIIRQGFNNTICDNIINTTTPNFNKTGFYNCTSTNLSNCGWGVGAIPSVGVSGAPNVWQVDTSLVATTQFVFISYYCNGSSTAAQSQAYYLRVSSNKGVTCLGNDYQSVVFDQYGTGSLGGSRSCTSGSFCDPGLQTNYSIASNITGTFCTPGCYDSIKDGSETDVDYGGAVCGNCSPDGKLSDTYYMFAREYQEGNTSSVLSASNVFNSAQYCQQGQDAGNATFSIFFVILLVGGIILVLLVVITIIVFVLLLAALGGKFLKRKTPKKR